MALTNTTIRNAKPQAKPYKLAGEKGLFLLVQPSGGMLWRFKFRVDGRDDQGNPKKIEKKLGLGIYAIATGRAQHDPASDLRGALIPPTVKHRAAITDPQKAGELMRAIGGYARTIGLPEKEAGARMIATSKDATGHSD